MLWRRGNMPYRPLVPEDTEVETLADDEWERFERSDTNFTWDKSKFEDDHERPRGLEDIVLALWDIACGWTELRGAWCDFRLFGHGEGGALLFQDGRRCVLGEEQGDAEPSSSREDERRHQRRERGGGPDWRALYATHTRSLEQVIGFNQREREQAVERSSQTLKDNHLAWAQIANAMRDTADFQREQMEAAYEMRSGAIQLKAHALEGIQKTQRMKDAGEIVKHGIDALVGNVIPFGERVLNLFGSDRVRPETFPQFTKAQQALHYIAATLTDTQLYLLFPDDEAAIRAFVGRLRQAEAMELEAQAVKHLTKILRVFKSKLWRDVGNPEQLLCATYIIGRVAIYQAAFYGEETDETDETSA